MHTHISSVIGLIQGGHAPDIGIAAERQTYQWASACSIVLAHNIRTTLDICGGTTSRRLKEGSC